MKQSRRIRIVLSGKQIMMMSLNVLNIHDVGKVPHKYCFLIREYEYKLNINEKDIGDVIIL